MRRRRIEGNRFETKHICSGRGHRNYKLSHKNDPQAIVCLNHTKKRIPQPSMAHIVAFLVPPGCASKLAASGVPSFSLHAVALTSDTASGVEGLWQHRRWERNAERTLTKILWCEQLAQTATAGPNCCLCKRCALQIWGHLF